MEETLVDVANTLLWEHMDNEYLGTTESLKAFLEFYQLTRNKKHSREGRVFLSACCSKIFSDILSELTEYQRDLLHSAYVSCVMDTIECWRADDTDNFELAIKCCLALLRVWIDRVEGTATDNEKTVIRILTSNLCLFVTNPDCTLLMHACKHVGLVVPHVFGFTEMVFTPNLKTIEFILSLNCPLALPEEEDEPLPNVIVRNAARYRWSGSYAREAMRCVSLLEEKGLRLNWEPIEDLREFVEGISGSEEEEDDDEEDEEEETN
jgi:hypothetical protein